MKRRPARLRITFSIIGSGTGFGVVGTISVRFLQAAVRQLSFLRSARTLAFAVCGALALAAPWPSRAADTPAVPQATSAEAAAPAPAPQTIGFREFMLDAERASIKTEGLRCVRAVATPWKEVCFTRYARDAGDRPTLIGAWVDDITLTFISNKLVGIDVSFESRAFSRVVRGLSNSYGAPTKEDQEIYSGGPGISIASPKTVWQTPQGTIVAREMAGQMNATARFYSNEMLNLVNRERQAGLRPKNAGL